MLVDQVMSSNDSNAPGPLSTGVATCLSRWVSRRSLKKRINNGKSIYANPAEPFGGKGLLRVRSKVIRRQTLDGSENTDFR